MNPQSKRSYATPKILHDLPLDAGDTAAFNFDEYAATLARLAADPNTRTPLTIGVSGAWGTGKTTLLRRVKLMLDEPYDKKTRSYRFANDKQEAESFRKCKTMWFDAWKYDDEDSLLAALVREILQSMKLESWWDKLKADWVDPGQVSVDYLGMFLSAFELNFGGIAKAKLDLKKYETPSPFPSHTAFFDYFDEALETLIACWVHNKLNFAKIDDCDGALVVFIDDLDRCLPAQAVQVLEAIKLFLDKPGCIFLLGADIDLIQDAVASHYKEISGQKADDYLEKVIQVRFRLPQILSDAMGSYLVGQPVDEAMQKRWEALTAAADVNPRRVKAVVNDLELQWHLLKNSGQAEGVHRDDFICWQALWRAAPRPFKEAFYRIPEDERGILFRHQFVMEALLWVNGTDDERGGVAAKFKEFEGGEAKRWREVLAKIVRFSEEFTPQALHAHVHLAAPPPRPAAEEGAEEKAAKASMPAYLEGAAQKRTIGGLEFVRVPAGAFIMGSKADNSLAFDDEQPQHTNEISSEYWLARAPVTNDQFRLFVEAKSFNTTAEKQGSGWVWSTGSEVKGATWERPLGTDSSIEGKGDHPVVQVSWQDALAYCQWFNQAHRSELEGLVVRLPSEAEWEKAARGEFGREWPWGDEWDASRCNSAEGGPGETTPVGAYSPLGDSSYGVVDMAGNVWEWTRSLLMPYRYNPDDGREDEGKDGARVLRGGSFNDSQRYVRAAFRSGRNPVDRDSHIGFRIVAFPI